MMNGSEMIVPTVRRGLSDEYGSWKIICISRRSGLISFVPRSAISRPSKRTEPDVGRSSRISSRAVVDLPQPLSPTIPNVSPRRPGGWRRRSFDGVSQRHGRACAVGRLAGGKALPELVARLLREQAGDLVIGPAVDRLQHRVDALVRLADERAAGMERAARRPRDQRRRPTLDRHELLVARRVE